MQLDKIKFIALLLIIASVINIEISSAEAIELDHQWPSIQAPNQEENSEPCHPGEDEDHSHQHGCHIGHCAAMNFSSNLGFDFASLQSPALTTLFISSPHRSDFLDTLFRPPIA